MLALYTNKCQAPQREATNLAVHVLGWWGMAPTSVPLSNAIKRFVYKKVVYSLSFPAL